MMRATPSTRTSAAAPCCLESRKAMRYSRPGGRGAPAPDRRVRSLGERLADDPLHQLARLEGGRRLDLIDEGERDGRDRRRPLPRQLLDRGAAVEPHDAHALRLHAPPIGRAHLLNPVNATYRIPASSC